MPKLVQYLKKTPTLPILLFVLGDIFMIPHGENMFSWVLFVPAALTAGFYFYNNWYRLGE